jgi:hypothetical protein
MAKIHGKNTDVFVNGNDLTTYFDNAALNHNADTAEVSTWGNTSKAYVAGLKDATLALDGLYDGDSDAVDEVLQTVFASDGNEISVYPEGDTVGKYGYGMVAIETAYSVTGAIGGACRISAAAQSNATSAERLVSLHALGEESASDWTGTANNYGASSSSGGSAYIHVTAVTGEVEVKIQHSSDNFSADTEDLESFTAVTAAGSERITFTGTVKQYVRGYATIGGAEAITFQLGFHRA